MKYWKLFLPLLLLTPLFTKDVFARVTPEDIYQAKRAQFENNLLKVNNLGQKQQIIQADKTLVLINQQVCNRFDVDIARMSAILEEEKSRQNITQTIVAYGRGDTPLDSAAYYLNYAAEAVAYQKVQDYTPSLGQANPQNAVNISANNLKSDLKILQGKILRAKTEVKKVLDYYE